MRCISIVRSLYFRIFSASFLITFLFPEIATYYYYYYYYYYYVPCCAYVYIGTVSKRSLHFWNAVRMLTVFYVFPTYTVNFLEHYRSVWRGPYALSQKTIFSSNASVRVTTPSLSMGLTRNRALRT
jgi:hypothetical protein